MTLQLTFDQEDAGITAGVAGRARTDILSTGPVGTRAYEVQIVISGVPDGATADIVLLDEPPDSNPLLTQIDPLNWTLAFDKDCWGPFRVRCRAVNAGAVVQSVARRISIRSPVLGIAYPANAERIDPNASSVASVASVALTEMNEGGTNRSLVDFYRAVVEALESGGGGAAELGGDAPWSDEFDGSVLDPKWVEWNQGAVDLTTGVDTTLHMASIEVNNGTKQWAGMVQAMPAASTYTIRTRVLADLIDTSGPNFDYQDVLIALVVGGDLIGDDGAPLLTTMARHVGEFSGGELRAVSDCAAGAYVAFDMGNDLATRANMPSWSVHLRVSVTPSGPDTIITMECSPTGETWQLLATITASFDIEYAGFAVQALDGRYVRACMDHFRLVEA